MVPKMDARGDEEGDRPVLRSVDRYFDRCSPPAAEGIEPANYRLRLVGPDFLDEDDFLEAFRRPNAAPIVTFVNKLLSRAVQHGVREARLVPLSTRTSLRFNRGQGFYEPFGDLPGSIASALVNRIRSIANMTLLPRNQPVSGKIRLSYFEEPESKQLRYFEDKPDEQLTFSVFTFPSVYGESLLLTGFTLSPSDEAFDDSLDLDRYLDR